jgi:hypothetical protein
MGGKLIYTCLQLEKGIEVILTLKVRISQVSIGLLLLGEIAILIIQLT